MPLCLRPCPLSYSDDNRLDMNLITFSKIFSTRTSFSCYDIRGLKLENRSSGFPTRSDTNRFLQLEKIARCRIYEEEELFYPCCENKGADQLWSYFIVIA